MKKIGILTYHRAHNFGAYLQAMALCQKLNQYEFIKAEIIDFRMCREVDSYSSISFFLKPIRPLKAKFYRKKYEAFCKAQDSAKHLYSKESIISDSIEDLRNMINGKYDIVVVGSDEVWKIDGYRGLPAPYFLPGEFGCRKFAYAVSSRSDFSNIAKKDYTKLLEDINSFEYIGVREKITRDRLRNLVANKKIIHLNYDPTFIFDFDISDVDITAIYKKYNISENKKTIVLMSDNGKINKKIALSLGRKYNFVSVFDYNIGYKNIADISPYEWLSIIKNADLVITNYYHAACFSIIYSRPFLVFGSKEKSSKIEELFDGNCLNDRYIKDADDIKTRKELKCLIERSFKPIDGSEFINRARNNFENDFLRFLIE